MAHNGLQPCAVGDFENEIINLKKNNINGKRKFE